MTQQSSPISLSRVRQLFSRPQHSAESAFLRREIATRMREKLELVNLNAHDVMDAGCGEGADLAALMDRFPQAQLIALDGSFAMLHLARSQELKRQAQSRKLLEKIWAKFQTATAREHYLCANFAQIPMAANSLDMIWSNLALHWHPQPDLVFAEWKRVLRAEGLVMFSCFGPDTLKELRLAFTTVDPEMHCLDFVDMHDFGDQLVSAGFSNPVMDMEKITLTYQTVASLLADVRSLGGNPLQHASQLRLSKTGYQQLHAALEAQRDMQGQLKLSIEVIYGHAFKPIPSKLASGESIVQFHPPKKSAQ
jgi:malonyl-CoA O-methyltransferase